MAASKIRTKVRIGSKGYENFLVYKIAHSGTLAEVIHVSNGVSGVQTLCTSLYAIHEIQEVEERKCSPGVAAHSTYFFKLFP